MPSDLIASEDGERSGVRRRMAGTQYAMGLQSYGIIGGGVNHSYHEEPGMEESEHKV